MGSGGECSPHGETPRPERNYIWRTRAPVLPLTASAARVVTDSTGPSAPANNEQYGGERLRRGCLSATPSDSGTHARRAHAYRELQNTPSVRLRHVRPAAHCSIPDHAPDMRTEHAYVPPMRPGCCERLTPCARPRSRAHCLCQMPDLRYLLKSTNQAQACDASGGFAQHCRGR